MLNAKDLLEDQKSRKETMKKVYKDLLEQCYKKIKSANTKFQTYIIFKLNAFVVGYPLYDVTYGLKYITHKLKKGGFKVTKYSENTILIDWTRT